MNGWELVYKLAELFFHTYFWTYIGLLLLVLAIKGDLQNALIGIGIYIKKIGTTFQKFTMRDNSFSQHRERYVKDDKKVE